VHPAASRDGLPRAALAPPRRGNLLEIHVSTLIADPVLAPDPVPSLRPSVRVGSWTGAGVLPPPVARFVDLAQLEGPERITTVAIRTTAAMHRPGMPAIPLVIGMYHRLGYEFAHDIAIGRGRLAFRFGTDAYVDGRGCMQVGRSFHAGPAFDQGALIAMWCEAIAYPSAWLSRTDVRWEDADWHAATFVIPGPDGDIPIRVAFDPGTGCPVSFTALRHKAESGLVAWTGRATDWRRFGGVLSPGRFEVEWADEAGPWLDMHVLDVLADAPVDEALDRARHLFDRR
jgi:hypothetical protein